MDHRDPLDHIFHFKEKGPVYGANIKLLLNWLTFKLVCQTKLKWLNQVGSTLCLGNWHWMNEVKIPVKVFCSLRRLKVEQGQWLRCVGYLEDLGPTSVSPDSTLLLLKTLPWIPTVQMLLWPNEDLLWSNKDAYLLQMLLGTGKN